MAVKDQLLAEWAVKCNTDSVRHQQRCIYYDNVRHQQRCIYYEPEVDAQGYLKSSIGRYVGCMYNKNFNECANKEVKTLLYKREFSKCPCQRGEAEDCLICNDCVFNEKLEDYKLEDYIPPKEKETCGFYAVGFWLMVLFVSFYFVANSEMFKAFLRGLNGN